MRFCASASVNPSRFDRPAAALELLCGPPRKLMCCTNCNMSNQQQMSSNAHGHNMDSTKTRLRFAGDALCHACFVKRLKETGAIVRDERKREPHELSKHKRRDDGSDDSSVGAVINFGVGHLLRASQAFLHCGAVAVASGDPAQILAAHRVVLPGIGACTNGMVALQLRGLADVVHPASDRGSPWLGICLGLQMPRHTGEAFGDTSGLGLILGPVVAVSNVATQSTPQFGRNGLVPGAAPAPAPWDGIAPGESVYFVHPLMPQPADAAHRLADCLFGGVRLSAVNRRRTVLGDRFHPEVSGAVRPRMRQNFLRP